MYWMYLCRRLVVAALLVVLATPGSALAQAGPTLRFAVTDVVGMEELRRDWQPFITAMQSLAGITLELVPMQKRDDAIRMFSDRTLDLALSGPAEYVVIRKRTEAKALVGLSRPDYFSVVVAMANSDIKTVQDLRKQKVAFSSVGSTSGHLAPMQVLKDYGIDPLRDVIAVHAKTQASWEALLRGNVAGMGFSNTEFLKFRAAASAYTAGDFRVLARSADLPGDVLMVGSHVADSDAAVVKDALLKHAPALIKAITATSGNRKYKGMQFLRNTEDQDYDGIRAMYATVGFPAYSTFIE